jgi:hypothetical protein
LPSARAIRPFLCAAAAGLLASLGCVDHNAGGKTLSVFDNTSNLVKVWSDINKLFDLGGGTAADPDRTIGVSTLSGVTLAWGGVAVDSNSDRIYLLSEGGTVYVITNASTRNGTLSNPASTDFYSFNLGSSSDRYDNDAFGQLAVDPTTNSLYAVESTLSGNKSRVWRVTSPSTQYFTTLDAASNTTNAGNDTYGAGVAAMNGGEAFALFGNGNTVFGGVGGITSYTGARVRLTSGKSFVSDPPYGSSGYQGNVIIGDTTGLTASLSYGAVAYDNQKSQVYVLAQGSGPVLVWNRSQFGTNYNQTPVRSLTNDSGLLSSLRTLSHPYDSDWLLGAYYTVAPASATTGTGGSNLLIWKEPSGGGTPVQVTLPGSLEVRGMAIGGSSD